MVHNVDGVRQGRILSALLFALVMNWTMKSFNGFKHGFEWVSPM